MNRREFLESSTAGAAVIALVGWPRSLAAQMPAKPIGIQIGAVSILDEGTEKVLDTLADLGSIDTLFLATFTTAAASAGASRAARRYLITASRNTTKTAPDDVYAAVKATFEAGANGIILSRKYSEMRLDNLRAAGRAIRETVKRA